MQLLGAVIGVAVLVVSAIVGAFMLAALLGFVLIVAVAFWLRVWWLRRQMDARARTQDEEVIVAEYRVVESRPQDPPGPTKGR